MAEQQPISWKTSVGLHNAGSYQVSGAPFASGSIDCTAFTGAKYRVVFPNVTRWVQVINNDVNKRLFVGFSDLGLTQTNNHIIIPKLGSEGRMPTTGMMELKVSEIWISGSSDVSIVAGLTNIDSGKTSTAKGSSWSGSAGVG